MDERTQRVKEEVAEDQLERTVAKYTVMAPSPHNSQPWKLKVGESRLEIRPNFKRKIEHTDPESRELFISLGCAAENLRVAANYFGFKTEIRFTDDGFVEFRLEPGYEGQDVFRLFHAISMRNTDRGDYDRRVEEQLMEKLLNFSTGNNLEINFLNGSEREKLAELQYRADKKLFSKRGYREELAEAVSQGRLGDGFISSIIGGFILRNFNIGKRIGSQDRQKLLESSDAVVFTGENNRENWFRTGILLESLWLKATVLGISVQPMSQTVEFKDTREELEDVVGGNPLQVLRLGYSDNNVSETPRKPLEEFME